MGAVAGLVGFIGAGLGPVPAGARGEFGGWWNLVIALDVINTIIVLLYLWRIWREKPASGGGHAVPS